MEIDVSKRYRLCQRLELKADATGTIAAWLPAQRSFAPLLPEQLAFLLSFGAHKSIVEVCREHGVELDDEIRESIAQYLALGLLLPEEPDPPAQSVAVVFDHIASIDLTVLDAATTIAFYRDALGCWIEQVGQDTVLRFGETALVVRSQASVTPTRIRLKARACDFGPAVARLQVKGAVGREEFLDRRRVYVCTDPSGHSIEIVEDVPRQSLTLSEIVAAEEPEPERPRHRRDRRPSWVLPFRDSGGRAGGNLGLWAAWEAEHFAHLPWYSLHFDAEFAEALALWAPLPGRFLELGCGPGTIAGRLASLGYEAVGIDIDQTRIAQANQKYVLHNPRLQYRVLDVLDANAVSSLGPFDYAFDRGCFHVLNSPELRQQYIESCARVLRPKGRLFLKTMSDLEPFAWGPNRHSFDGIAQAFGQHFRVIEQVLSSLESTLTHQPKALFSVLERREDTEMQVLNREYERSG